MKIITVLLSAACAITVLSTTAPAVLIDIETPSLGAATHQEDWRPAGGFASDSAFFNNDYNALFGSWAGFALSRETDTTTAGFFNQYSAFAGSGAGGSSQFAIGFVDTFTPVLPTITLPLGQRALSLEITNNTYAGLSMRDGDPFAKKFGGASQNDPDFFLLTITGRDALNASTGQVDFYLADYRFSDNSLDYIVKTWRTVDLSSLTAGTTKIEFTLSSSDNGRFGMNTPGYFAVDRVTLVPEMGHAGLALLGVIGAGTRRRNA